MADQQKDGTTKGGPPPADEADAIAADDPKKTEKLAKHGRNIDPDEGSD